MAKKLSQFLLPLILYPVLYHFAISLRLGETNPLWFRWLKITGIEGVIVLGFLWLVPLRPAARAIVYVPSMMVVGYAYQFMINMGGLSNPDSGWSGMLGVFGYVFLPIFVPAVLVAVVVWLLNEWDKRRGLSNERPDRARVNLK